MSQGPWSRHSRNTAVSDDIDFEIKGQELQFVEIELDPGESAVAEAGSFVWKDASVEMTTMFGDGSGGQGGGFGASPRFGVPRLRGPAYAAANGPTA